MKIKPATPARAAVSAIQSAARAEVAAVAAEISELRCALAGLLKARPLPDDLRHVSDETIAAYDVAQATLEATRPCRGVQ